jgi:hypothetical protein
MLFRTNKGTLIEIKKYDCLNDQLYYKKIMEIKKPVEENFFAKLEKTFNNKKN